LLVIVATVGNWFALQSSRGAVAAEKSDGGRGWAILGGLGVPRKALVLC
jgi:hypothetical protein